MSKRWTIRIVSFEGVIRLVTQLSVKRKLAWESKQSFKGNYVTSRLLVQKQSKNNICTSSHGGILQDHPVVDESDVLWRILAAWSFTSQQMKNSCGKDSVFTVFNELTQMAQSCQVKKKILSLFCDFHTCNSRERVREHFFWEKEPQCRSTMYKAHSKTGRRHEEKKFAPPEDIIADYTGMSTYRKSSN